MYLLYEWTLTYVLGSSIKVKTCINLQGLFVNQQSLLIKTTELRNNIICQYVFKP